MVRYYFIIPACLLLPITLQAQGNTSVDVTDALTGVAIVLFLLSVIVEKITQLIRKYAPFTGGAAKVDLGKLSHVWQNIQHRQEGDGFAHEGYIA